MASQTPRFSPCHLTNLDLNARSAPAMPFFVMARLRQWTVMAYAGQASASGAVCHRVPSGSPSLVKRRQLTFLFLGEIRNENQSLFLSVERHARACVAPPHPEPAPPRRSALRCIR